MSLCLSLSLSSWPARLFSHPRVRYVASCHGFCIFFPSRSIVFTLQLLSVASFLSTRARSLSIYIRLQSARKNKLRIIQRMMRGALFRSRINRGRVHIRVIFGDVKFLSCCSSHMYGIFKSVFVQTAALGIQMINDDRFGTLNGQRD